MPVGGKHRIPINDKEDEDAMEVIVDFASQILKHDERANSPMPPCKVCCQLYILVLGFCNLSHKLYEFCNFFFTIMRPLK
jgi:hypothetical protein